MIEVSVQYIIDDVSGFRVEGHSNLGPPGADIVCAAVSAVTQTALLGLQHKGLIKCLETAKGLLDVKTIPSYVTEIIIETMLLGLHEVARQYPERIRIRDPD